MGCPFTTAVTGDNTVSVALLRSLSPILSKTSLSTSVALKHDTYFALVSRDPKMLIP